MALSWFDLAPTGSPDQMMWVVSPSGYATPLADIDGDTHHCYNSIDQLNSFRQKVATWSAVSGVLSVNRLRVQGMIATDGSGGYMNFGLEVAGTPYWAAGDLWGNATYTHKIKDWMTNPATGVAWTEADLLAGNVWPLFRGWSYSNPTDRIKITYARIRVYAEVFPAAFLNPITMTFTPNASNVYGVKPMTLEARGDVVHEIEQKGEIVTTIEQRGGLVSKIEERGGRYRQ